MASAGWSYGRILETVWFVGTRQSTEQVFDHVNQILSKNDQQIVGRCDEAVWRNLLATTQAQNLSTRLNHLGRNNQLGMLDFVCLARFHGRAP